MNRRIRNLVQTALGRRGYQITRQDTHDLVWRDYYSPLPDLDDIPESFWDTERPMTGVELGIDAAVELLEGPLAPYLAEFQPPFDRVDEGFFLDNNAYGPVDAEVLYAVVRYLQPARIVELGSGVSSHVIAAARARNQTKAEHIVFDPFPFSSGLFGAVADAVVHPQRAEDLDAEAISSMLGANDILFVDTTHTVKTGGDVDRIVLDLLPRLAAGVWVHIHDVFLPYEYPREWVVRDRRAWAEQYLLQAFLAFNDAFRVELPLHAAIRAHPESIHRLIPSSRTGRPAGFWLRRL